MKEENVYMTHFSITDSLSRLFSAEAKFIANSSLDIEKLIGKDVFIEICVEDNIRNVNGIIISIDCDYIASHSINDSYKCLFTMQIRPQLWLLSLNRKNRIFNKLSAIDIITTILKEHKITNEMRCSQAGKIQRDICIQYGESDFDFLQRIMEEEGVFFYYEHKEKEHILNICDTNKKAIKLKNDVIFRGANVHQDIMFIGVIYNLGTKFQIVPKSSMCFAFDFEKPDKLVKSTKKSVVQSAYGDQFYNVTGNVSAADKLSDSVNSLCNVTLKASENNCKILHCNGVGYNTSLGKVFKLSNHPLKELNTDYFIIHSEDVFSRSSHGESVTFGSDDIGISYNQKLEMCLASDEYLPQKVASPIKIPIIQTGIVGGKTNGAVEVDDYGRVQVILHWNIDEKGEVAKSECWARVMTPSAQNKSGIMVLPRVGNEVIVAFLGANELVIIGMLRNKTVKHPHDLKSKEGYESWICADAEQGKSIEISFQVLSGEKQELYLYSPHDLTLKAENNIKIEAENISIVAKKKAKIHCGKSKITLATAKLKLKAEIINLN
jgi:type VI secretion system secreted protein VgrG